MTILLIVESPSKCKKIESYLGNGYKVVASCGHICKLDSLDQINFDNYSIKFKIDKRKVVNMLKSEISKATEVILATDDDREGEAISWHICQMCKLNIKTTKKISFQEITKSAILKALENPTVIDMQRVYSQQSRQILDIYLGYKISPMLWKYIQNKLSAGRCQTPALRLIYENEQLFKERKVETYYQFCGYFTPKAIKFTNNSKISSDDAKEYMENHINHEFKIVNTTIKDHSEQAPYPFITSTLQQKSSSILHMSPKITMSCAQKLYENGLITYMRTDSKIYSGTFIKIGVDFVSSSFGENYVRENVWSLNKAKNSGSAQEAHEAIRVTDIKKSECPINDNSCKRLYKLIYENTLCSLMACYKSKHHKYDINAPEYDNKKCYYSSTFQTSVFYGWKIVMKDKIIKEDEVNNTNIQYLNNFMDKPVIYKWIEANEKMSGHLSHYNEASLVSKLETLNIGRPSTYASIIESLISKKYVSKTNIDGVKINSVIYKLTKGSSTINEEEKEIEMNKETKRMKITPIGTNVIEFCMKYFGSLFDYEFTEKMENDLDEISSGLANHVDKLGDFKVNVDNMLKETKEYFKENKEEQLTIKEKHTYHCGDYKGKPFIIKHGPYGYYIQHDKSKVSLSNYEQSILHNAVQTQELEDIEREKIIKYYNDSFQQKNTNMVLQINDAVSIRRSKYGVYVFYKNKKMKKPQFLKYDVSKNETLQTWLDNSDKESILSYLIEKYKITY